MKNLVCINKPTGLTSSDVVVRVRNILSEKLGYKVKVGHMGTLDPGASGVLIVGIDKGARLFDYFQKNKKVYIGRLSFTKKTDTLDSFGVVIEENNKKPSYEVIKAAIAAFMGHIEQIPPKYSAIKINGQKAYQMARKNEEINFKPRKITIFNIEIIRYSGNLESIDSVDLKIECSSGTYIRTLFEDLASSIAMLGYMSYLIRTQIGIYSIDNAITLDEFNSNPLYYLLNPLDYLKTIMPIYYLNEEEYVLLKNGREIKIGLDANYIVTIYENDLKFILINKDGKYKSITNLE